MCELTYIRCGDYFIPNITVPEEPGTITRAVVDVLRQNHVLDNLNETDQLTIMF